jgi:hypothetical protein
MRQAGKYDITFVTTSDPKSESELPSLSELDAAEMDEIRELREIVTQMLEAPQTSFTTT